MASKMTPQHGKSGHQSSPTMVRIGGFAIGDNIVVTAPKSTYHGRRGEVVDFCKNGSHKFLYVELDGEKKSTRLAVQSLSGVHDVESVPKKHVIETDVLKSVPVRTPSIKGVEPVSFSTLSPMSEVATAVSGAGARSRSTRGSQYNQRVLNLYEYVSTLREEHRENQNLAIKLKEIEKMIVGLSLSDE